MKKSYIIITSLCLIVVILLAAFISYQNSEITWNINQIFNNHYTGDQYPNSHINVAILDSVISNHTEFKTNIIWIKDVRNGTEIYCSTTPCSPYTLYNDTEHGTFIAGLIASKKDNIGIVGINPNVNIYEIIVGDYDNKNSFISGTNPIWEAQGIYAAVYGPDGKLDTKDDANIISMSFGGEENDSGLMNAIQFAYQHNVVLVADSGNIGGGGLMKGQDYFPAAFPEVIGVGATCENKSIAEFSNTGPFDEIVAPGCNLKSTIDTNQYRTWSGTSFAVPEVVGVISLLMSKYGKLPVGSFRDMNNSTIRGLLHSMALDLGEPGYDYTYGYGLVQF